MALGARFAQATASSMSLTSQIEKPAMSSRDSANGPSRTVRLAPSQTIRLAWALFWRPAAAMKMPAWTSSSVNLSIAANASSISGSFRRSIPWSSERRLAGEPIAYLTGRKAFHGLELHIDARVLDPRADTETLVDWALELLPADAPRRVLDLGTGSGAIALAIARQRPAARVAAVDASADALAVATANARRLGLSLDLRHGHWFGPVVGETFDLVISNPPYIAVDDAHLPSLTHEPRQALVSGADGLDDIRRIVAAAPAHLAPGGWLLLEHGWGQAAAVRALLGDAGFADIHSRRDLAGIERGSGGYCPA